MEGTMGVVNRMDGGRDRPGESFTAYVDLARKDVKGLALGGLDRSGNWVDGNDIPLLFNRCSFVILDQADWRAGSGQSADCISD